MLMFCPTLAWKQMSGISTFPTGVGRLGPGCPPTQRIGLPFCLSFNSTPPSLSPREPPSCWRWWWWWCAKLSGLLSLVEEQQGPSTCAWRGQEGGQLPPTPSCSRHRSPGTKKGLSEALVGKIEWLPGSWKSRRAGYAEYCTFIPASSQPSRVWGVGFAQPWGHYPGSPSPLCPCSVRWSLLFILLFQKRVLFLTNDYFFTDISGTPFRWARTCGTNTVCQKPDQGQQISPFFS